MSRIGETITLADVANVPAMGNNLEKLRKARRWTHQKAADKMGISRGQLIKLERGERRLAEKYIRMAAETYQVPEGEVMSPAPTVRRVGYVGAGDDFHFYEEGQGPFDEVPSIDGANESTVAVEIRGSSMGPLFDGWLAYYDDRRTPPTMDLVGHLCVVGLDDGRVLIKRIARYRGARHFDLWSNAEQPMFDVPISWAAKVLTIRPK